MKRFLISIIVFTIVQGHIINFDKIEAIVPVHRTDSWIIIEGQQDDKILIEGMTPVQVWRLAIKNKITGV